MANGVSLTAADILLRLGLDPASGIEAEVAAKTTAVERQVIASGERIAAATGVSSDKAVVAQLRLVSAKEKYNAVLQREGVTEGQIAAAQASLIAAQGRYTASTREAIAATETHASSTLVTAKHLASVALFLGGAEALRDGVHVLEDYQANLAQTRAALASTGGVANVTSEDVQKLGESIQGYSGQSREAIIHSENLLLTYTNVRNEVGKGNDVFDRATEALADLSARGFGTAETNAKSLGRALQDPLSGLTLLRRSGITFTRDQQDTVKALVAQNKLLDAQKFILDVINQKVGGSARAYKDTLAGSIDVTKRSLEDVEREVIGFTEPLIKGAAVVASFFGGNRLARDATTGAVGIVAALALVNKAVKFYGEVSDNVFRRNAEKVASNEALAVSYGGVATAANSAAVAEERAAVAGGAGGARAAEGAGAGFAARFGPKALLGSAVSNPVTAVAATLVVGSALLNKTADDGLSQFERLARTDPTAARKQLQDLQSEIARVSSLARGTGGRTSGQDPVAGLRQQASLLSKAIADAAPGIKAAASRSGADAGGAFSDAFKASARATDFATLTPFSGGQRSENISQARQALADAIAARNQAAGSLADARSSASGVGGTGATSTDLRVAELRVEAARANARKDGTTSSEEATLLSAEQRLNDLRSKGKATADQTAGAEGKIADAIRSQTDAQKAVNKARKALDEAHGISAAEALKKIRADARAEGNLRADLDKLTAAGATKGELDRLKILDQQAPGTLDRIGALGSKALVAFNTSFNRELTKINGRKSAVEKLFDGAETVSEKHGERMAAALQRGFARKLKDFDPVAFFTGSGPGHALDDRPPTLSAKVLSAGFPTP